MNTHHLKQFIRPRTFVRHCALAVAAMTTLTLTPAASAQIQTVPPGLNPGDQYRLVFVTSTEMYGRANAGGGTGPTSINDFNTFATNTATAVPALSALGTTWKAIVSVRTSNGSLVTAKSNTNTPDGTGVPIYNLGGLPVASTYTQLWSSALTNPINVTELGGDPAPQSGGYYRVHTGMTDNGGASGDWSLCYPTGGYALAGMPTTTAANFTNNSPPSWCSQLGEGDPNAYSYEQMPIYVISDVLTVPLPGTDLLSFIWGSHIGVIDQEAKTVSLEVPYGTDVTTINPTCAVSSGATVSPASGANAGFTPSNLTVTYTVTSGASHTDYAATVTVAPASAACDMLTFKVGTFSALIDGTEATLVLPMGTDVTALTPTYTISPNAMQDASYPSGTARNFTTPQTYTITAQNGTTTQDYTVRVLTSPVTVPRGLAAGSQYRLVFATSTERDALSTDIADYNAFVTAAAAGAPDVSSLATTWACVGSTLNVNANANTLTRTTDPSVPIYNLGGVRLADGNSDLWDSSIANPINFNEFGAVNADPKSWTGTNSSGVRGGDWFLGDTGGGYVYYGNLAGMTGAGGGSAWVNNLGEQKTTSNSLFAISAVLTVPEDGSPACNMLSSNYGSAVGVITPGTPNTVLLTVPYGAPPLTALTPTVTTSAFATFTPTGAQDFSNSQAVPVAYTVTAEDGITQQTYQVTVVKAAASTACDMVSFEAAGVAGVITPGTPNTVMVTLPPGSDVSALTPTVVVSPLASYVPTGPRDFTNSVAVPVPYTVTAEDGTTHKVYQVTVAVAGPPSNDNFANAIALPGTSGIRSGTGNQYATLETGEPSISGATHTVWFKWTAPSNGSYTISTLGSTKLGGGEWDAMLGIYTGTAVDALTAVPGLLNGNPQDTGVEESLTMTVTAGTTYHIQVAGFENQVATDIKLTCTFVGTGTSYATWAAANGASEDPLADSNNNGVPNGVEFFMGATPGNPATLPPLVNTAGTWSWTIPYDPTALANYKFQVSDDLSAWQDVLPDDPSITPLPSPDRLKLTLPAGMNFVRLLVTTP